MMSADWVDQLLDSMPIRSVYGKGVPSLDEVDLHEVIVHRDGPQVSLRFDVKGFSENPPKKWIAQGFNKIQLQMSAIDVQSFSMMGVGVKMLANIEIFRREDFIHLRVRGRGFRMHSKARFLNVDKISGYLDSL